MIKLIIKGTEYNLANYMQITDFKISSPAFSYYTEKVDYRLGEVMTGQTLSSRSLEVVGLIRKDFISTQSTLFNLLGEESYELIDSRLPDKVWKVSTDTITTSQIHETLGNVTIKFKCFDGYCRSKTAKVVSSTNTSFSVTNNGGLVCDPRCHKLLIELKGTATSQFRIINETTNETIVFNDVPITSNNMITVDGIYYKKDGALITSKTNMALISLAKGTNQIKVEGVTSPTTKITYYEYYL